MAYKCVNCGHIFEEGEQSIYLERCGFEFCSHEKFSACPLCGSDYEETVECDICGAQHLRDELKGGACAECIEEHWGDLDLCFRIGSNDTTGVRLNCFLASAFDKEEIEMILFDVLETRKKYSSESVRAICESFAKDDIDWFGEVLAEEVKKNENGKN